MRPPLHFPLLWTGQEEIEGLGEDVAYRTSHIASPSFEKIIPLLKQKVKAVILLDDSASNSLVSNSLVSNGLVSNGLVSNVANRKSQIANHVERVYTAHHIEHAVELAYTVGVPGDAVLFSPVAPQKEDVRYAMCDMRCEDPLAMTGSRSTLNPQLSTFNFQLSVGDAFAAAVKKL